jgi:tRNA pseudouridine38-40 synthase
VASKSISQIIKTKLSRTLKYFIKLSYNGENYHGWQIQKNGISVEEILEKCISIILKEPINIIGVGRTDKGVHAKQFIGHFIYNNVVTRKKIDKINYFLPNDIKVYHIQSVPPYAHARYSAIIRTYEYRIVLGKNPFVYNISWQYKKDLDIKNMNNASKILIKYKNFYTFSKSYCNKPICNINKAHWKKKGDLLIFEISSNRFIRNMVRSIVGTIIDIGRRKITLEKFISLIENRNNCGISAPAKGLFLKKILYPKYLIT